MDSRSIKVTLDATLRRDFGRGAHYTATYLGLVNATAETVADARAKLAENLHHYISNATTKPVFATDDDGSLVVAVAEGSGTAVYRVRDGDARCITIAEGSPAAYVERVPHYTPIN